MFMFFLRAITFLYFYTYDIPPEGGYDLSPLWISNAADLRYAWGRMEGQSDLVAAIIEFEEYMLALFLASSVA